MSRTCVVIAEIRDGKLRQVTLEAIGAALQAKRADDRIHGIVIGHHIQAVANHLATFGIDRVYAIDHAELKTYHPENYLAALNMVMDQIIPAPELIVLGHTAIGRDVAPMIAAKRHIGQISDVIRIEQEDNDVLYTRPIYAGKAFEKKRGTGGPLVVTIRPNNFPAAAHMDAPLAEVVPVAFSPPVSLAAEVKAVVRKVTGKVDLSEAKIVIAGGRGVRSAEGFKPLEELADVLSAAIGASRGACDAGYCDYALQIGQTGKVVTPELYIACGISGAIQHLAGMSQSRVIVAINKDPDAPIFKVADYGIVGDLFEVVPMLTAAFKKALA